MPYVERIETFLLDAGCATRAARQLKLVAEELLTNIVREAWPEREPGLCMVDVTVTAEADAMQVTLRTQDDGIAFDPTAMEEPDVEAVLDERSVGGLGILLVRTMTDSQVYRRVGNRNVLELRKACELR